MTGELDGWHSGGDDRARLRISDDDRHRVAEVLREAAGEGRLDLDELDQRLEAAYAAKTYADLVPITVDLPARPGETGPAASPRPPVAGGGQVFESSVAIMSGQDRRGAWHVGPTHTALAVMGGVNLDLREAVFHSREVVINANAVMGGVEIIVNSGTQVSVEGFGIMGGFDQARDRVDPAFGPDSPLVRVRGFALMGGVNVVRKPMPGERRRPLLPRR